jgi:N-acetylmuramoyl-L-alanine amidase
VWLAGCSSPTLLPSALTRVPGTADPDRPATLRVAAQPRVSATGPKLAEVPAKDLSGHDDPLPVADANVSNSATIDQPTDDWVSLESWGATNHFGAARSPTSTSGPGYELRTPGGIITVVAGSQIARLDGMSYWLGFAPRIVDGRLLVHSLDARKNLWPVTNRREFRAPPNRVVAIDAGHGGENMGAQSVADHRWEKEFTLDWALRLQPLLESNGWRVILTRTSDTDVSLPDRVAVADKANAALFISLHFNSGARSDQSGLETYCLTPTGMPSTLTRDYEDDLTREFPNNTFDSQNLEYAVLLHRSLLEAKGGTDRGVRRARFMVVLRGQKRPAVLVEGGYLSNPTEARAIADPAYRQKLAQAVAKALAWTGPGREPANAANQGAP